MRKFLRAVAFLLLLSCVLSLASCEPVMKHTKLRECPSYEVYVFPMAKDSYRCFILSGTHRVKTYGELFDASLRSLSIDEAKAELDGYEVDDKTIILHPYSCTYSSYLGTAEDYAKSKIRGLFDNRYGFTDDRDRNGVLASAPEDFEFTFVWNIHGISSYDSRTHILIRAGDADDMDAFTAEHVLTDVERNEIYTLLTQCIDLYSYPEKFDPANKPNARRKTITIPSLYTEITLTANGKTHKVTAEIDPFSQTRAFWCEEAAEFVDVYEALSNLFVSTEEWKAFPENPKRYL